MKCPKCQHENPEDSTFCGKCATNLGHEVQPVLTETFETQEVELATGSLFAGRYQIIEELGRGGMGRVYRVLDKKLCEEVALKLIKPEIASDKKTLERFKNELKLARKVSQKNVGRMFDMGEETGTHYITMEYIPGEDLKDSIRRFGQLPIGKSISIARQLCDGLSEAHRLGIIHRDLKSSNIMIDKDGNARIMDFGIARSLREKGITGGAVMIGTPEYMSPEQVEAKDVDQRSDIYSLGIILYEMLTGRLPFEADSPFAVGIKQKSEAPKDPKELNPQIPDQLGGLIRKCLEKNKESRYQTAGQVGSELETIEAGMPETGTVVAKKKSHASREITVKFDLKKIALPGAAVAILAAAAALLLIFLPKRQAPVGPKIENSIAVISFKNQTGDPAFDYLQDVIPNLLITNLENSGLFYVTTWERMQDVLKQMGIKPAGIVDDDLGFEICRREGIRAIAIGTFSKAGEVFVMDVKVLDAETKRALKSANTRGTGADSIFGSQIDELSREISLGLGAGMDRVELAQLNIKGITTHSLEAYRYFLKGKEACNLMKWSEARNNLEKALEIDPAFGMAYVYLAWSFLDPGPEAAIVETLEKAKTLSDRTSQKDSLYLEGLYARFIEKDTGKAVRLLDELIRRFPDEKWALHISGDFVRHEGDLEGAYSRYKKWLDLDPQDLNALFHISRASASLGDFEKAEEYIKRHEAIAPLEVNNLSLEALVYRHMGRLENVIAKYRKAHEVSPESISPLIDLVYIYSLKEDYDEALKSAEESVTQSKSQGGGLLAWAYQYRGDVHILKGALDEAMADYDRGIEAVRAEASMDKAWLFESKGFGHLIRGEYEASRQSFERMKTSLAEVSKAISPINRVELNFDTGMLALRQGQFAQAEARLAEIRTLLPEFNAELRPEAQLRYDLLQGERLLIQGKWDEALTWAKKACTPGSVDWKRGNTIYITQAYYLDLAARIFAGKGDLRQAIVEYERLLATNYSTGFQFLLHPLYHYRLALLYEKADESLKAGTQLERFLDLWKDADPGLAEVEDARERLKRLRGN